MARGGSGALYRAPILNPRYQLYLQVTNTEAMELPLQLADLDHYVVISVFSKMGIYYNGFFASYRLRIGVTFKILIFSFALSFRINEERVERIRAQELALQREIEAKQEAKVRCPCSRSIPPVVAGRYCSSDTAVPASRYWPDP